jgi:predicted P-loop ATPase
MGIQRARRVERGGGSVSPVGGLADVIPIRPPQDAETIEWFRANITKPYDPAVVFAPETPARAAQWASDSATGVTLREIVKASGAPIGAWDSAVKKARREGSARAQSRAEWEKRLVLKPGEDDGGELVPSAANVTTILRNEATWSGVVAWDEFKQQIIFRRAAPWYEDDKPADGVQMAGASLNDSDQTRMSSWMVRSRYRMNVSEQVAYRGARIAAEGDSFDSLRDYLDGLKWDGVSRIATFAETYLGAVGTDYTRFVLKAYLVSAVARGYEPGCKVDHVLVLAGNQDRGKTSALRALFADLYTDSKIDLASKDRFVNMAGMWCISFDELASLGKSDHETVKNFITSQKDKYRAPYAAHSTEVARRSVFAATVNPQEDCGYLKDATGNRRFWPIDCAAANPIDAVTLAADRDQIWAEAVALYRAGTKWHPVTDYEKALCRGEQDKRAERSAWSDLVAGWLDGKAQTCQSCRGKAADCRACAGTGATKGRDMAVPYVTQGMIFTGVLNISPERWPNHNAKLAAVLAALGWKSKRQEIDGTKVTAYYPAGHDHTAPTATVEPAAAPPRVPDGHCEACAKPKGRGAGKCQSCGVCSGCLDVPAGVHGACHCEAG